MKQYRSIILFLQSNIILFRLEILLVLHFCLQVSRLWIIYASNSNLISMTMCIPSISKICYSVLFSKRRKNRGSVLAIAHLSITISTTCKVAQTSARNYYSIMIICHMQ